MLAGIEAGSIMVLLFNPLWVVRTRMALQGAETLKPGQHKYTGMIGKYACLLFSVSWCYLSMC